MTPPAAAVPNGRVTGPAVHLRRPGPAAGSTRPQWSRAAIAARPAGQGSGAPAWRPKAQYGWCDHLAFQDRNVTFTLFVPEPSRLATALPETPHQNANDRLRYTRGDSGVSAGQRSNTTRASTRNAAGGYRWQPGP